MHTVVLHQRMRSVMPTAAQAGNMGWSAMHMDVPLPKSLSAMPMVAPHLDSESVMLTGAWLRHRIAKTAHDHVSTFVGILVHKIALDIWQVTDGH